MTLSMLVADDGRGIESPIHGFDSPAYALRWQFPPASFHAQFARYWLRACLTSWLAGERDRNAVECLFSDLMEVIAAETPAPIVVTVDISPDHVSCRVSYRRDPHSGIRQNDRAAQSVMSAATERTSAPLVWGTGEDGDGFSCWFAASVAGSRDLPAA